MPSMPFEAAMNRPAAASYCRTRALADLADAARCRVSRCNGSAELARSAVAVP